MKKVLYILLLLVELVVGFALLAVATISIRWIGFCIVTAVWAALTVWMLAKLKKADSDQDRRKVKRWLALVMLLPAVAAVIAIFVFVMIAIQYI